MYKRSIFQLPNACQNYSMSDYHVKEQSVNFLRPDMLTHKKFINKEIIVVADSSTQKWL